MEKYFRVDVNKTNIIIDLNYNEEKHTFVIEDDFEDSWTDIIISGKVKTVNVYVDDVTDEFKMTIYTEIDGFLSDDEIIKCDGYDIIPNFTVKELLETPKKVRITYMNRNETIKALEDLGHKVSPNTTLEILHCTLLRYKQ